MISLKRWDHRDAEVCLRLERWEKSRRFRIISAMPEQKILSIFVDESGRFLHPDSQSRFYIIGLVLHDQADRIDEQIKVLDRRDEELGLDSECFVFHAGPLIRQEKGYSVMNRSFRARIFERMMTFANHVKYNYRCLCVDKAFVDSELQIVSKLKTQLTEFLRSQHARFEAFDQVNVYYDCGQSPLTNILHQVFEVSVPVPVKFVQGVKPENYKLFQLADLLCSLHLIRKRLEVGEMMTHPEERLFGGPRHFKRNVLKQILSHEIN